MNHQGDDLTDFERRVLTETTRGLSEQLTGTHLDLLGEKGYVIKGRPGSYKVSEKRFLDLLMQAADDIDKKVAPVKNWKDPRPVLSWHMARIVLGYEVDTPHDRMNPEEMGRLMSVIHVPLKKQYSNPTMLRLAFRL
jgi:hypothetical protein